jgi:hypothetical protein
MEKEQVFAVVRWDKDLSNPQDAFTVKEILISMENAIEEVDRLNKLNHDKNVIYYWRTTRLYKKDRKIKS